MLKLCMVTKVKVFFLVLVWFLILTYVNFRPPFWRRVYYTLTSKNVTTLLFTRAFVT